MRENLIAITGMSIRLPGARSPRKFWHNISKGEVSIRRYGAEDLKARGVDPSILNRASYVNADAALDGVDLFDPDFFRFSQREAELLDPQHRLLLECAWELMETAGYGRVCRSRASVGVFAGCSMNTYLLQHGVGSVDLVSLEGTELMLTNDKDYLSSRISYKLGLTGPSVAIQTGCSTSLVAVHYAAQSLLAGECDIALAGGVSINSLRRPGYFYEPGLMFSPDGACRAFDANASGTPFGDGVGLISMRRLQDALDQGDTVHAVIRGTATNNDGAARAGFTAPSVDGQQSLILEAQTVAGVGPDEIGMIEAHGTGTRLGDPIEFAALTGAFREGTYRRSFCSLGSVKANLGHLAAAAGIAGLVKAVLSVQNGLVPPHPSFHDPNPALGIGESPFFINTKLANWPVSGARIAGISSFGVGGSNAHVIIENAPSRADRRAERRWRAYPLSAPSPETLTTLAQSLAERLTAEPDADLGDVAHTLQSGRATQACRDVVMARDESQLISALRALSSGSAVKSVEAVRFVLAIDDDPDCVDCRNDPVFAQEIARYSELFRANRSEIESKLDPAQDLDRSDDYEKTVERLARVAGAISIWMRFVSAPLVILTSGLAETATAYVLDHHSNNTALQADLTLMRHSEPAELWSLDRGRLRPETSGTRRDGTAASSHFTFGTNDLILLSASGQKMVDRVQSASDAGATVVHATPDHVGDEAFATLLGTLWTFGLDVRWDLCNDASCAPVRIPLPVHALNYRSCWLSDPGLASDSRLADRPGAEKSGPPAGSCGFSYTESWVRAGKPSSGAAPDMPDTVLLFEQRPSDFGDALGRRLGANGGRLARVRCGATTARVDGGYIVNVADEAGFTKLVQILTADGVSLSRVVFCHDLDLHARAAGFDYELYGLLELVKALSGECRFGIQIDVVSNGVFVVTGNEAIVAERSATLGAMRVVAQEYPQVNWRLLDVGPAARATPGLISEVLDELFYPGGVRDQLLAFRNGWRWRQEFVAAPQIRSRALPQGFVCLVSGGLGQVGFTLGKRLGKSYGARLGIISRQPIPERDQWSQILRNKSSSAEICEKIRRLLELEDAGIEYCIAVADVSAPDQLRAAVASIERRLGTVQAFVHAAGPSGPETIQWIGRTTRGDWSRLLLSRYAGAKNLHTALNDNSLLFGCFISSLAGVLGGLGYAAYAAANRACDGLAQQYRDEKPYFSIDWDRWEGWGAAASPDIAGEPTLSKHEAAGLFEQALHIVGEGRVLVSKTPLHARIARSSGEKAQQSVEANQALSEPATEQRMEKIWADVLRTPIDRGANFFDLGGDSLIGTDLIKRVNVTFGSTLNIVDLFECPTVTQMTDRISTPVLERA